MGRPVFGNFGSSADWGGGRAMAKGRGALKLLQSLRSGIVAEQIFENGEDVLAVLDDAFQNRTKLRLALGFAVPLREHRGGDANVAAQFVSGMAAQEKAIEKRGFALRELEVLQGLIERVGLGRHGRNRSLQISMSASSGAAA
jgi:hypothetical protein